EPEPEFESVQTEPTNLPLAELDPNAPESPVAEAESAEMADEEDSAAPDVAATQQPVEPAAPALPTLYLRWRGQSGPWVLRSLLSRVPYAVRSTHTPP